MKTDSKSEFWRQQSLFGDKLYLNEGELSAGDAMSDAAADQEAGAQLAALETELQSCQRCGLGQSRRNLVFGVGSANARLVLVGEAPGAEEDACGEPFVGRAGQLLNKILVAIGLTREQVFIANVLKCRPPQNRDPNLAEVAQCEPFLIQQLQIIRPRLIVALGRIAGNTLLKSAVSLRDLRGTVHDYHGIPLLVTYHPAALLRNPHWKKPAWEDMKQVRSLYRGESIDE